LITSEATWLRMSYITTTLNDSTLINTLIDDGGVFPNTVIHRQRRFCF